MKRKTEQIVRKVIIGIGIGAAISTLLLNHPDWSAAASGLTILAFLMSAEIDRAERGKE